MPVTRIRGTFCPYKGGYMSRIAWRNDGDRPARTLYVTIQVYDKSDKLTQWSVVNYPIYSVADNEPGIAPGETYFPRADEGLFIPEEPGRVTDGDLYAIEKGIRQEPGTVHVSP
jgi:hypothetical protein